MSQRKPPRGFATNSTYARGLPFVSEDKTKNHGKPWDITNRKNWEREWNDQFNRTVRCSRCGWETTGDGKTCRSLFTKHRKKCA